MKVLLVINKPERESQIMELIKREILILKKDAIVEIREMCTPKFNRFVFGFRPNVILTFPFTCEGFSQIYYLFKILFGVKILSMRAEGVVDFDSEYEIERCVGYDDYGNNLVDYELSWGEKFARIIGEKLVEQDKLFSLDNIRAVGHPGLEDYYSQEKNDTLLPLRLLESLKNYKKKNIIFFVTGFVMADYTRKNLIDARDMGGEDKIDIALEGVEIIKKLRVDWIKNIVITAKENTDALIVVKRHPLENKAQYKESFKGIDNILYIYESISISDIISYVGLYIHYGSTSLIDTYISKTPSIYASAHYNKQWYSDLGWPSSLHVDINEIPVAVKTFRKGHLLFNMSDEVKQVMKEMFNIEDGKEYTPSKEIAKVILDPVLPKKIKYTDPYLLRALGSIFYTYTFGRFVNLLKKYIIDTMGGKIKF